MCFFSQPTQAYSYATMLCSEGKLIQKTLSPLQFNCPVKFLFSLKLQALSGLYTIPKQRRNKTCGQIGRKSSCPTFHYIKILTVPLIIKKKTLFESTIHQPGCKCFPVLIYGDPQDTIRKHCSTVRLSFEWSHHTEECLEDSTQTQTTLRHRMGLEGLRENFALNIFHCSAGRKTENV